ncbi:hypothetical protein ACFQZV_07455 [Microbacterium koreense]|uniref:Transcriptional regulator, AbiEi antitoxin, Type IV TA system n=1 Tax=Microbacterium koreense TaxID=323761 RepID=A0ABW2ZRF3_9MICO
MEPLASRSTRPYSLLLASDARGQGWASALQTAARRGAVVKVRPGVYLDAPVWSAMTPEDRYLARINAVGLTFRRPVFMLESAAAVYELPLLRTRLRGIHLARTTPSGSGRRGDVTVHDPGRTLDVVEIDGLRVSSLSECVWDLACRLPHPEALAIADAALRRPSPDEASDACAGATMHRRLLDLARARLSARGGWSALLAIEQADAGSGSLGESVARSAMLRLGAPPPELQAPMWDDDGLIGYADFFWREHGVVGEFDGKLKYGADNPSGRPPEDVVYREKIREDRIRAVTAGFFRCGWADVNDPRRLERLLRAAGLPLAPTSAATRASRPTPGHLPLVGSSAEPKRSR